MDVLLFVRSPSRKLRLTPAGEKLLEHARWLFLRLERVKRVVRETDARYRMPIRIGVADGIAQPKLSECFGSWRASAPNIALEITEMRAVELLAALRREEIDVGFSFGVLDNEAVVQDAAWSYQLVALLPLGHELAERDVLSISELLAFPMIASHPDRLPGLRRQLDAVRRRYAASPIIAGEARTLAGYITRVAAGLGIGVADTGHMETLRRTDVVTVPLVEDIRINTYVLYKPQSHELHDALQRFLAHLKTLN